LIAAASVTEMMVMITLCDAQSSIVERDHWSIDFVARTHHLVASVGTNGGALTMKARAAPVRWPATGRRARFEPALERT
jgi:hypothetical protein